MRNVGIIMVLTFLIVACNPASKDAKKKIK